MDDFKPTVQLSEEDGNVFGIIARVKRALKKAGQHDRSAEFSRQALELDSYTDVLRLAYEYVEIQ